MALPPKLGLVFAGVFRQRGWQVVPLWGDRGGDRRSTTDPTGVHMSTFTMPATGTPEYDTLMERWASKPISFGQCGRLKSLLRSVQAADLAKVALPAKDRKRVIALDLLKRDDDRRWVNLRSDVLGEAGVTMADAHRWGTAFEALTSDDAAPVTVTQTAPKATPAKAEKAADQRVSFKSGDVILVDGEAFELHRNGKRVYVRKV